MGACRRFFGSRRGHVAVMTALMMPVAVTLAAFAVDAGSLYVEKRQAQALADLAAIAAASRLDDPHGAALATMTANGVLVPDHGDVTVLPGRYLGEAGLAPNKRFQPGATPVNAVRLSYRTTGSRYFAGAIIPPPQIGVEAVAATSAQAAFSIGSRLLELDDGVANSLLSSLLGGGISLSVMDYNALIGADVGLLSFLDALALEIGLTAGSYGQALHTQVTAAQIARALSKAEGIDGTARAALAKLAMQASTANAARLSLSSLIGLGDKDGQLARAALDRIDADIGVMELLMTSAIVAGKGRQVALGSALSVPDLLSVKIDLAIGEPPQHSFWFTVGSGGELVRTAQTRLRLVAEIGGVLGERIRVPLYLELAHAEARLLSVTCPGGRDDPRVAIEARPGVVNLYLAEVDPSKIGNFASPVPRSPAVLLQVPLLATVTGQAQVEIAETGYKTLVFSAADIAAARVRQASTTQPLASLTGSLFSSLSLKLSVVGPGIGLPGNLLGTVGGLLVAATGALDAALITLLETLGVSIGQADVTVHAADCGRAVLVQ